MTKSKASKKEQNVQVGWDLVLQDAHAALRSARSRTRHLKRSIATIEQKISKGEPLPDFLRNASTQN